MYSSYIISHWIWFFFFKYNFVCFCYFVKICCKVRLIQIPHFFCLFPKCSGEFSIIFFKLWLFEISFITFIKTAFDKTIILSITNTVWHRWQSCKLRTQLRPVKANVRVVPTPSSITRKKGVVLTRLRIGHSKLRTGSISTMNLPRDVDAVDKQRLQWALL